MLIRRCFPVAVRRPQVRCAVVPTTEGRQKSEDRSRKFDSFRFDLMIDIGIATSPSLSRMTSMHLVDRKIEQSGIKCRLKHFSRVFSRAIEYFVKYRSGSDRLMFLQLLRRFVYWSEAIAVRMSARYHTVHRELDSFSQSVQKIEISFRQYLAVTLWPLPLHSSIFLLLPRLWTPYSAL